ncbi:putative bifunctional diguanylate cyclase/phosphodiesterase [Egicoccus halophilus]|uniref:GGDEF-domain containing protein n=1 Tax=Egicoccus halophilus TaxID=1670830 RepID=A0A8J3EU13_9ACTN|nr:bifunctional diguanylate cyclase/phosphodiesterase [Egicoccus halophilus]GGI06190.1 GGDEF-domain containing protein [Egicoccus halophilus]
MRDRSRGAHLAPVLRPDGFAVWWWLSVLAAAAVLALLLGPDLPAAIVAAGPGFWLLFGFVVLGELRPVVASGRVDPEGVTLSTAFLFAVLLRWGPELALFSVVAAAAVGETARRKRLFAASFNGAQYVLSYGAAWAVLHAAGWQASPQAPATLPPGALWLVLLAAGVYHLINLGVVGTAIGLVERRPVRAAVFENVAYFTMTTGAVLALSPLVVVVLAVDWAFLPLLLLPLFLLWKTAAMSLEREERSLHDGLTGLANRTLLADRVHAHLAAGRPGALCLLDLDRFKEVNDTLGHAVGDDLLVRVAERLRDAIGDQGIAARIGGDEFVLLLESADEAEALATLSCLGRTLLQPYELGGARLEVEVSIGLAMLGTHGGDLEVLQRHADAAMYAAKEAGDLVAVFRPGLQQSVPSRLSLLAELRGATQRGELEVHYQPQVAVVGGAPRGMEALVRWRHPQRGLLPPAEFLPLAERTAVMRSVTSAVLEQVLGQLAVWQQAGLAVPVAVNVSLHDLADPAFAGRVRDGLRDHGVPPDLLTLEITEEALVGDPGRALATLDACRATGVELSLDDFGTGHSSLLRLKRLPVSEVKIDRSFVRSLDEAPDGPDAAIVRSVVELTRGLGLRCVAEGVETRRALAVLRRIGCDVAQGFLVARPLPSGEATEWLRGALARGSRPGEDRAGRSTTSASLRGGLSPLR